MLFCHVQRKIFINLVALVLNGIIASLQLRGLFPSMSGVGGNALLEIPPRKKTSEMFNCGRQSAMTGSFH
jgi:hypothetical protein